MAEDMSIYPHDEYGLMARLNVRRPGDLDLIMRGFRYRNRKDQMLRCDHCAETWWISNASLDGEACPTCGALMPPDSGWGR